MSVEDFGTLDMEEVYLPQVLACENGAASPASLRAQAIAARSYAYYVTEVEERSLEPTVRDQVYGCGVEPQAKHVAAVRATAGMVMTFQDIQVAGFYVAGAEQSPPSCEGGTEDPTDTEKHVTYNDGATGSNVESTSLAGRNSHNRGCMSQHGANCLADIGYSTEDILRYYYGADIEVIQTRGACVPEGAGPKEEGQPWISTPCEENSTCSFEAEGKPGECLTWFDKDDIELYGFCTIGCDGLCPDSMDHARTMCVNIDGRGQCAVESTVENGFCADLLGTENKVMERFPDDTSLPDVRTMCAPPHASAVRCAAGAGRCINVDRTQCEGQLRGDGCPGGENIQCCTP